MANRHERRAEVAMERKQAGLEKVANRLKEKREKEKLNRKLKNKNLIEMKND